MTIADSLILLNNTKQSIKTAIENKGVTVGAAPFADYAGKIGEIPSGISFPDVGDAFGGGYFVGVLLLSDGIFANIVSPYTGGHLGNRTNGTLAAWSFPIEYFDPRIGDAGMPGNSQAKTQANALALNGYDDWMLPSLYQGQQYTTNFAQHGWTGEIGIGAAASYYMHSCTESAADSTYSWILGISTSGMPEASAAPKNSSRVARAFRLEKLADLP